ncbi:hypothetical protein MIND_00712800 [Mycena indigotica]|uniref:DUF788-domain-containing protein n=1 Tax=Mycena indigotica TaxID=2126181 RepID=A0A8H6SLD9_9AGAR|nr:uncharacterized protein MIND_00712800 [Mycena indigotica]KAF7301474.1 hypothetical protein MIND_00712800 [Mycena indigotica]
MANAAAKKIASQNEATVKTLKLGMLLPTILSLILRFLFRRSSLPPSKGSLFLYTATFFPAFFLSNYLIKIGTTRRDPTTGTLISFGEDLSQPGVIEWCFDVLYITCKSRLCQIGSGAFGEWFWWFYMVIPLYAIFKLWTSFISPMVFGRSSAPPEESTPQESTSKRQEKLRKRNERGDPRVRAQTVKR